MRKLLVAFGLLCVASPAFAGDGYGRPFSWTGFYGGVHAGYAFNGDAVYTYTVAGNFEPANRPRPTELDGFIGGGQLGYNWQFGRTVLGVEASLSGSDLQDTLLENPLPGGNDYRTNSKINYLASLTGRLGYAFDRTLVYAKGGIAFTTIEFDASFISGGGRTSISNDFDRTGWVAGVGVEHAFTRNWSFAVEYTHIDFGSEHVTLPVTNSGITTEQLNGDFKIDTITARLNYKFGG